MNIRRASREYSTSVRQAVREREAFIPGPRTTKRRIVPDPERARIVWPFDDEGVGITADGE